MEVGVTSPSEQKYALFLRCKNLQLKGGLSWPNPIVYLFESSGGESLGEGGEGEEEGEGCFEREENEGEKGKEKKKKRKITDWKLVGNTELQMQDPDPRFLRSISVSLEPNKHFRCQIFNIPTHHTNDFKPETKIPDKKYLIHKVTTPAHLITSAPNFKLKKNKVCFTLAPFTPSERNVSLRFDFAAHSLPNTISATLHPWLLIHRCNVLPESDPSNLSLVSSPSSTFPSPFPPSPSPSPLSSLFPLPSQSFSGKRRGSAPSSLIEKKGKEKEEKEAIEIEEEIVAGKGKEVEGYEENKEACEYLVGKNGPETAKSYNFTPLAKTEKAKGAQPKWNRIEVIIPETALDFPLRVECWAGVSGRHDYLIGAAEFALGQIIKVVQSISGHVTFPLIHKGRRSTLALYQNSGLLHISRFSFKPLIESRKEREKGGLEGGNIGNHWTEGKQEEEERKTPPPTSVLGIEIELEGTAKGEKGEGKGQGEEEGEDLEDGELLIVGNEAPLDKKHLFPSQSYIGWLTQLKNFSSMNLNNEFQELYSSFSTKQKAPSRLPPFAKNYAYLICKGFMGGFVVGYWARYFAHLKSNFHAVMVPLHTVASSIHNAEIIKKYILKQTKPVILIGHSKGGVDSVVALSLFPELKEKVRGIICVQSPHGGSPVANDFVHKDSAAVFFSGALRSLMGDPKSMDQLTYQFRRNFMSENPPPLDVPILCFASAIGNRFSILRLFHNYVMDRYNEPNDGMVCVCDAILPGCMSVVVEETDHSETVVPSTPMTKYSKNRLMDALLCLFFQHSTSATDTEE